MMKSKKKKNKKKKKTINKKRDSRQKRWELPRSKASMVPRRLYIHRNFTRIQRIHLSSNTFCKVSARHMHGYTVDSRYLEFQGTLKYFEISVPHHIRFAEFRKKINRRTTFNKCVCNLTPDFRDVLKILWKREVFSTIFCYLLLDLHV